MAALAAVAQDIAILHSGCREATATPSGARPSQLSVYSSNPRRRSMQLSKIQMGIRRMTRRNLPSASLVVWRHLVVDVAD